MSVDLICSHCNSSSFNFEIWLAKLILFNSYSSSFAVSTMLSSVSRLIVPSRITDLSSNSKTSFLYDSMASLQPFNCSFKDWINPLSTFLACSHFNNSSFNSEIWSFNFTLFNSKSSSFAFNIFVSSVSRLIVPSYDETIFSDLSVNNEISFLCDSIVSL